MLKKAPSDLMRSRNFESQWEQVEGSYLTMGRYDLVLIVDAPNAETAAKIILTVTSGGAVATRRIRACGHVPARDGHVPTCGLPTAGSTLASPRNLGDRNGGEREDVRRRGRGDAWPRYLDRL